MLMEPNLKLTKDGGEALVDPAKYRRLVGGLFYLTLTRPILSMAINKLSQCIAAPRTTHVATTIKVLRKLWVKSYYSLIHQINS